jgi:hypothetical protein
MTRKSSRWCTIFGKAEGKMQNEETLPLSAGDVSSFFIPPSSFEVSLAPSSALS